MTYVDRPIFIVGCPRSGTGILHQMVRLHPSVAWITPLSNWVCGKSWFEAIPPSLARIVESLLLHLPNAALPQRLRGPFDGSLDLPGVFETHEGHSIWNRVFGDAAHHRATEAAVSPAVRDYLQAVARWHRRYHRRPRFVNKTPRNALRLRFLHAVFPNAFIVHLVRDGRAVAASILKRRRAEGLDARQWWGARPPGWRSVRTDSPLAQAAWTWRQCLSHVEADASVYPDDQFLELHYESFTRDPDTTLRRLFSFVGLSTADFFTPTNRQQLDQIHDARPTWQRLSRDQQVDLERRLAPTLQRYGYEASGA